jgi:hypothetical protein
LFRIIFRIVFGTIFPCEELGTSGMTLLLVFVVLVVFQTGARLMPRALALANGALIILLVHVGLLPLSARVLHLAIFAAVALEGWFQAGGKILCNEISWCRPDRDWKDVDQ